jgi:KUP system potassium uptake protein
MTVWFFALAWGGIEHAGEHPQVWQALDPMVGLSFMWQHGLSGMIALGAVFLAVTGAEALYADLGHFGRRPIRLAWLWLVLPSLALNYTGQAALVLGRPEAAENSFFLLYPEWALPFMVGLATVATVIAAQAVITGAFSLTHQAVQLGLLPRQQVCYTSGDHAGQIYLPQMNWMLLLGVILLVAVFHTSSNLAAAYGIAVTGTMVASSGLLFIAMRRLWRWPLAAALCVIVPLLAVELLFLTANLSKFFEGGFIPVLLSAGLVLMMSTWMRGVRTLSAQAAESNRTLEFLFNDLSRDVPRRVEGTAVYLTSTPAFVPSALLYNLKHNKVLHDHNVLLHLSFDTRPTVPEERRVSVERVSQDFTRITLHYGFMDTPNVTRAFFKLRECGQFQFDLMTTTFFIARRTIVPSRQFGMPLWRDRIFINMANNASDAASYFRLPRGRVVELGVQMTV